jgi:ferredoxin
MSENKHILICQCAERGLLMDADEASGLVAPEQAVTVADLCRSALENDSVLSEIASAGTPEIRACHPRAVRALFEFSGYPLPDATEFVNLRDPSKKSVLETADTIWYPVLDQERCTHCGQCLEFCLFGVYEKDGEGRVRVVNPERCKNNCPACARICPEAAIIFPKVGESPINGAEISDDEALKANIKVNVDEILGDDVYAALNARKLKRRSLLNQKMIDQALAERKECSEKQP